MKINKTVSSLSHSLHSLLKKQNKQKLLKASEGQESQANSSGKPQESNRKGRKETYPNSERQKSKSRNGCATAATNRQGIVLGGGISFTIAG